MLSGVHDATFTYNGGYYSSEAGDIDPGLTFGHGFLAPGSGEGARFDFWLSLDGIVDGDGPAGGGGASTTSVEYAAGANDMFLGTLTMNEDGVDQYMGGSGLDIDSFAVSANLTNHVGQGADGVIAAYGRVFENANPQVGDWYYVGAPQILRDISVSGTPPNAIPIGRSEGIAGLDQVDGTMYSFLVTGEPVTTTSTTTSTTTTTSTSTTTTSSLSLIHISEPTRPY